MRHFLPVFILAAAGLILAGCSLAADITPPPGYQSPTAAEASSISAFPLVAPDPSQAVDVYAEKCAPCHGDTGQGDGAQASALPVTVPAIGSAEIARQARPADWFALVTEGRIDRMMPGFSGSLSDSQRWDVISYVLSLSRPTAELDQGGQVFQAECASCHASDFSSPEMASALSLAEIKSAVEQGTSSGMPAFSGKLPEDDLWAVSAYVQSLSLGRLPAGVAQVVETPAGGSTPQPGAAGQSTPAAQPAGTPTPGSTASTLGSVSGQVINGSGGQVPEGLTVTLQGYDDMEQVVSLDTQTGAEGKYLFENVEMPAGRVFMTSADYKDTVFNSDVAHVSGEAAPLSLDVIIYDTTSDTSALQVDRMHVLFDFSTQGSVQVVEMFIISNPSENVIMASQPGDPVVEYGLPEGAAELQFQDGELGGRFVKTAAGFGDIQAIPPGISSHQVLFAYTLPYDRSLDLAIPLPMAVDAAVVLVPEGGVKVTSDQLVDAGTRDAEGTTLHVYSGSALSAGSSLVMTLKGKPGDVSAASLLNSADTTGLALGIAAFGLALLGLGAWIYFTRVRPKMLPAAAAIQPAGADAPDDAGSLMDAIIALDDQYRTGGLPEDAYRQRRTDLKGRLAAALGSQKDGG